jgi:hypothetical protein
MFDVYLSNKGNFILVIPRGLPIPTDQAPERWRRRKVVASVGEKLWAGDCMNAAALRGAEPTAETTPPALPEQAGSAIPPGQTR